MILWKGNDETAEESPLGLCVTHPPLSVSGLSQTCLLLSTPGSLVFGKPHAYSPDLPPPRGPEGETNPQLAGEARTEVFVFAVGGVGRGAVTSALGRLPEAPGFSQRRSEAQTERLVPTVDGSVLPTSLCPSAQGGHLPKARGGVGWTRSEKTLFC